MTDGLDLKWSLYLVDRSSQKVTVKCFGYSGSGEIYLKSFLAQFSMLYLKQNCFLRMFPVCSHSQCFLVYDGEVFELVA